MSENGESVKSLGWWIISGEALLDLLREAHAGADPDLLYAEHYSNSDHEAPSDDEASHAVTGERSLLGVKPSEEDDELAHWLAEQSVCPDCDGSGHEERIDWSDVDVPCRRCGGTGDNSGDTNG